MKTATSLTIWNDAIGKRISVTYSVIDETTGQVTADNKRIDRVITDSDQKTTLNNALSIAQDFLDKIDS